MKYKLISILTKDSNSILKEEYYDSTLKFSGNFLIIEKGMGDYSTLRVFNLNDVDKIRTYNKLEKE